MRDHWSPVLILFALAVAGCQPSQGAAQTQAAQSEFNAALAAAQTQAAPPEPTRTPAATGTPAPTVDPTPSGPIPTWSPEQLQLMALSIKGYLEGRVSGYDPKDGSPYDAHVSLVEFQYYDNDKAAVMDVLVKKSDDTPPASVVVAALNALTAMYRPAVGLAFDTEAHGQVLALPRQLRVFRVHISDPNGKVRFRFSGNWNDVMAFGNGSLAEDDFMQRLQFEKAVE